MLTFQGGKTPLVIAASLGHTKVVKLLLEKGCDPNSFDTVNTRNNQFYLYICKRIGLNLYMVPFVSLFHYLAMLDAVNNCGNQFNLAIKCLVHRDIP